MTEIGVQIAKALYLKYRTNLSKKERNLFVTCILTFGILNWVSFVKSSID